MAGGRPPAPKSTSLCRQAAELIDYLASALVVTEVATVTTTTTTTVAT